jgi:6-phosphogluconolactonase
MKRARRSFESFAALAKAGAAPGKRETGGTVSRRSWAGATGQADIVPGQGLSQLGAEFSPTHPSRLFVSNAHNGAGLGTVSAYRDGFSGRLVPIGSSPYADGQTAPCWVEISHDGRYLFTVNTGSANISSYSISRRGSLTLIGSTPIRGGGADTDLRLSPDGRTLPADGSGNHILSVFAVHGGTLTELPSSPAPLPAGGAPAGIVSI